MRIKRLEIYGFGKWVDETFELSEDIQIFYGKNEAGKSTLMSFIHSILFGFPTRNSTLLRYEPHGSSKYGGKIMAEDKRFGEVVIERVHGKVTGNVTVTLENGTTGGEELLETILSKITRETFQQIFSFSLTDIENVHQLDKEQLSRYLLNIGAHGTDRYLDMVDELHKESDKIYRPTGRVLPLNQQLTALEKHEKRLAELEVKNEGYLHLIEDYTNHLKEIERLETKQKETKDKLEHVLALKKEWHVLEEINTLTEEIEHIQLPPLKEDGKGLYEEYKKEISELNEALQEINLAIQLKKEQLIHPDELDHYYQHQVTIQELEEKLPEMIELLSEYRLLWNGGVETKKQVALLKNQLQLKENTLYPRNISEESQEKILEWKETHEAQQIEIDALTRDIQQAGNELAIKNQKLDQLEAVMWDQAQFKKVEQQLQEKPTTKKQRTKFPALMIGLVGVLLVLGSFLMEPPMQWVLLGLGILTVAGGVWAFTRKKDTNPENSSTVFMQTEYEKQNSLKAQWRDALSEIDALQEMLHEKEQLQESFARTKQMIEENWVETLTEHRLPAELPFLDAVSIFEQVDQLTSLVDRVKKNDEREQELKETLLETTAPILKIIEQTGEQKQISPVIFEERVQQFRKYLSKLKGILLEEDQKIEELNQLKREQQQCIATKTTTNNKMNALIEMSGATSEAEFFEMYQQKEQLNQKKNRLAFLKENTPSFSTADALETKESLLEKELKLQGDISDLAEQNKKAVLELANDQLSIEHLEKDGTYTEELQHFENEKATAQLLFDEWVSSKVAAGIIQETLNQVTKERFDEIILDAQQYFHLLTNEEYERIVFKENELFVQHKNGQVVDVKVLSRGTSEPLYVAIRLAYIKNTQDMLQVPIIMDDPFVNFDRMRQRNMYELMQKLGEDLQIIYFTFDPIALEYFEDEQITRLNER